MQIVIDIPEETYGFLKKYGTDGGIVEKAVLNGTPLSKGHGRLIDESDLMPDSDYEDGIFYAVSIGMIGNAPTIIEADKAGEEE